MALVKFFAAARGFSKVREINLPVSNQVEFIKALEELGKDDLKKLASISTFLINGKRFALAEISEIQDTDVIEMLPPFAGG